MSNLTDIRSKIEVETLLKALDKSGEAISKRMSYLEFDQADVEVLAGLGGRLQQYRQHFDELLHAHMSASPRLADLMRSASDERVKIVQSSYAGTLSDSPQDLTYLRDRVHVGMVLQDLGLEPEWYLGIYRKYLEALLPVLWEISEEDFRRFSVHVNALTKIIFFDIGVALDSYFLAAQKEQQQLREEALRNAGEAGSASMRDELTGLPSRPLLADRMQQAFIQADREKKLVALLHLGIDNFRLINDAAGYATGDQILKNIGETLQKCVREGDTLSYHGADEFVIVLRNMDETRHAAAICDKISQAIAKPFVVNGKDYHVTCSIGLAFYPQDGKDAATLSKYADIALTRAKNLGRNNYQLFSTDMNEETQAKITIVNDLRQAIANGDMHVHYQPKADLRTGKIAGMEALVRWQHPVLKMVPPSRFIPVAEESGLINRLGEWVIGQVCTDIRNWLDQGIQVPNVAVNVSLRQFLDPLFCEKLVRALSEKQIPATLLSLEITESILMNHNVALDALLKELKNLGISLALDDFGTGYSALSYLKHFPFDHVKIDQSFVRDITVNTGDAAISNAVISMAHSLGIRVIAEGVETEAQCEYLSKQMCDEVQGYLFSKPAAAADVTPLLQNGHSLPSHLLHAEKPARTLLLVDDEPNILASLKRLLRRDGYQILSAEGGQDGLALLEKNKVDVIVSDQRMPNMTGVEFLRIAKKAYPDTVRIVLSGYTELQSITDAINEGAIYKFLTKPWEDEQLRANVQEAFQYKEMADENRRLNVQVQSANQELAAANRQLADMLQIKQQQIKRDEISLEIAREALQHIPLPLIAIDEEGMMAFINTAAEHLFREADPMLGANIDELLPDFGRKLDDVAQGENFSLEIGGRLFHTSWRTMGESSKSRGKLVTFNQAIS